MSSNNVGLKNQGATCYLNSMIQSTFSIPEFTQELSSLEEKDIYDEYGKIPQQNNVLFEYLSLICKMKSSSNKEFSTKSLTDAFGWKESQLHEQHDVNDMWNILLDGLNEAMPSDKKFLNKHFRGKMITITNCKECEYISPRTEHFTQINVQLVKQVTNNIIITHKNLMDCLESYLTIEKLCGTNLYKCEECEAKVIAHRFSKITSLPTILVFNLNRYIYQNDLRIKLNCPIKCPFNLDLSDFIRHKYSEMESNMINEYHLWVIMTHAGGSGNGHYTTYARDCNKNNKWLHFDDTKVKNATTKEIELLFCSSKVTPYMLIYRRKYMDDSNITTIPKFMHSVIDNK